MREIIEQKVNDLFDSIDVDIDGFETPIVYILMRYVDKKYEQTKLSKSILNSVAFIFNQVNNYIAYVNQDKFKIGNATLTLDNIDYDIENIVAKDDNIYLIMSKSIGDSDVYVKQLIPSKIGMLQLLDVNDSELEDDIKVEYKRSLKDKE